MTDSDKSLDALTGRVVVLDVVSPYVYVGTLADIDQHYFVLEQADVHDLRDTATTREVYVLDCKRHGVNWNRQRVLVRRDDVISISALDEVRE